MESIDKHIAHPKYKPAIIIICFIFFVFGFTTWINGVLVPFLRIACELNELQSYFVTFTFYIAYTVMAFPSGYLLKKTGMIGGMQVGFAVMALGSLIFLPAAYERSYVYFLAGLFITGIGLTILQVAVNPYITLIGPRETAAKRISIMGFCNKIAGVVAPFVLGSILLKQSNIDLLKKSIELSPEEREKYLDTLSMTIIWPYLVIASVLLLLPFILSIAKLPGIQIKENVTRQCMPAKKVRTQVFLGFMAVFFAVGVEVISGDTISNYGTYQGISLSVVKYLASATLGAMLLGYIVGSFCIPRYFTQEKAFLVCSVLGFLDSIIIIFAPGITSVVLLALAGFFNALLWPVIWPHALKNLGGSQINKASSVLIMGIAGGALLPLLYGYFTTVIGNQYAYVVLMPSYFFLVLYGLNIMKAEKREKTNRPPVDDNGLPVVIDINKTTHVFKK